MKSKNAIAYDCYLIAKIAHEGQKRRNGEDYINHPVRVAHFVDEKDGDCFIPICAAYLHDVLEDTKETRQSLEEKQVPKEILDVVEILTHKEGEDYFNYIRRIAANPVAKIVEMADIVDNITDSPSAKQIDKYARALKILHGVDFKTNLKKLRENQPKVSKEEAYAQMEKHLAESKKIHQK